MGAGSTEDIFVIWDFETRALGVPLESLARHALVGGAKFVVPGVTAARSGDIFRARVLPAIAAANRAVAIVQKPNANVGFEIGLALGLGKPVVLLHWGKERPEWLDEPPFSGLFVRAVETAEEIRAALANDRGLTLTNAPALPNAEEPLFLCPTGGEGEACRREKEALSIGAVEPPNARFTFEDCERLFGRAGRVTWTLTAYPESSDARDGAENTCWAAIAGWFAGKVLGTDRGSSDVTERWQELRTRLFVLRSADARRIVDVELLECEWKGLEAYRRHLLRTVGSGEDTAAVGAELAGGAGAGIVPRDDTVRLERPAPLPASSRASRYRSLLIVWIGCLLASCAVCYIADPRPLTGDEWLGAAALSLIATLLVAAFLHRHRQSQESI